MKNTRMTVENSVVTRDIVDIRSQVAELLIRNLKLEMSGDVTPEKFAKAINGKVWRTKDGKIVNVYFNIRNDGEHFRCDKKGDKYIYTLQLSKDAARGYENLGGRGAVYRVTKDIAFRLGVELYVESERYYHEEWCKEQEKNMQALSSDLSFEDFCNNEDNEIEEFDAQAHYKYYYNQFQYYNKYVRF